MGYFLSPHPESNREQQGSKPRVCNPSAGALSKLFGQLDGLCLKGELLDDIPVSLALLSYDLADLVDVGLVDLVLVEPAVKYHGVIQ